MPRIPKTTVTRSPRNSIASRSLATETPVVAIAPETPISQEASSPKKNLFVPAFLVLLVLLVAALGAAGYFYYQFKKFGAGGSAEAEEIEKLNKEVGAIFDLPGETPTLATVTDKGKLAEQPFFQKAENGDKVLFYSQAGKAILYRPSAKKIIDVTAINVVEKESSGTTSSSANEENKQKSDSQTSPNPAVATVALYNGSTKVGVTNALEGRLTVGVNGIAITKKEKAVKSDYTETQVIDLSGNHADTVKNIADVLEGRVASGLPSGETSPGTDILVIVGNE